MPASDFIKNLRSRIGHDLLHLVGVSAVVVNEEGGVLLVHSKERGNWMPIGGMVEPGEEPADAVVREVFEETGVHVVPERLVGVYDGPSVTYMNGDRVQYVTIVFRCRPIGGSPHVHDDENTDVRYFPAGELPELRADHRRNIDHALLEQPAAIFLRRSV
jgi:8-oxo-dGTP pyrophosphatase MutT (NUDIX family)